ncbi:MAG: amidohydrolase [Bacillota bacterium]
MAYIIVGRFLLAPGGEVKENWGVRVEGNRITAVGPNYEISGLTKPGDEIINARRSFIAPGFTNSHVHMYGYLAHGIPVPTVPGGFASFLEDFWWPLVEDRLDHRGIQAATALACLEMLKSGVTSFCDILEAPAAIPGGLRAQAEVVERTGLRGLLSFEATERVGEENGRLGLEENATFARAQAAKDSLVKGILSVHTTFTCSVPFLKRARAIASELGCGLHMHLSESSFEPKVCLERHGTTPVELYDSIGFLGPDVLASQCVQVSPKEIGILVERGVRVSHMPLSNCEVGGGVAPIPDLLKAGATCGLGTDGYINNFFELMRGAFLIHKAHRQDPTVMPARVVWDMATRGGAAAMGLDAGELKPGKLADLIVVDSYLPTPVAQHNAFDQFVLYRNPGDVQHVMIDGKFAVRDGKVLTLDEDEVIAQARKAARRLWKGIE